MNTGAITVRYATALLNYTKETGRAAQVCEQVQAMLDNPDVVPSPVEPDLEKFIALLSERGRLDYLKTIFHTYVRMYYESEGIRTATLFTVVPAPELAQKLKNLLEQQFGCRVELRTKTDPSIIGGFVLELGDYMLDASVKRQIENIRRQFVSNTNRIV